MAACAAAALWEEVLSLLSQAQAFFALKFGWEPRVNVYSGMRFQSRACRPRPAARSTCATPFRLNEPYSSACPQLRYNSALVACGNAGAWQQALAILQQLPAAGLQADAIGYSATLLAAAGLAV